MNIHVIGIADKKYLIVEFDPGSFQVGPRIINSRLLHDPVSSLFVLGIEAGFYVSAGVLNSEVSELIIFISCHWMRETL